MDARYWACSYGDEQGEQFRVLYLNRLHALLEDALIAQGTVDAVRPSLRTIVARALQTKATGLVAARSSCGS